MVLSLSPVNAEGSSVDLGRGCTLVLGRDPSQCDVSVLDPEVSQRHCRLSVSGPLAWLEDLGSRNGTYVNGYPIGSAPLRPGDIIRIGRCRLHLD